jgi:hypothetical protein
MNLNYLKMNMLSNLRPGRVIGGLAILAAWSCSTVYAEVTEFDLGLRYDRGRSGHGLEIHRADDRYAVFFYTYGEDFQPEWYYCDGSVVHGVMLGDCLHITSPPSTSPPVVTDASRKISFSLDYASADASPSCLDGVDRSNARQLAEFTWRADGEFHQWCTEFLPIGAFYPEPYYGGLWYGGDNGGYGCSMSHMAEALSAICYYYDSAGSPRWTIGLGKVTDESIEMTHYRGFCRQCDVSALEPTVSGSLTLELDRNTPPGSGSDRATLSLSYPEEPGGEFEKEFVLYRLTDGRPLGEYQVPLEPLQSATSIAAWEADLQFILSQLETIHPEPFHTITKAEFLAIMSSVSTRLPRLTDNQIKFEMMRLVARISHFGRDGHTGLIPLGSRVLPLQFYLFADGLFIVDALPPYLNLIGARVTHLGEFDVEEAMRLVGLALQKDNENTLKFIMPTALLFTDLYPALGFSVDDQNIRLTFTSNSGDSAEQLFDPISIQSYNEWKLLGKNTLPTRPVTYLSDTEKPFWFALLHNDTTLYIQYNQVLAQDPDGQSIQAFSDALDAAFESQQAQRVVIDLRHNNGGDNTVYGPLLQFLSRPEVNRDDALFAIIGRQTYSAAMNFIADLEATTQALFVGEGSGGSPFHFGDSDDSVLPNSGMLLQISSRVHPSAIPGDERLEIPADIPAPLSSQQFIENLDPALEAILEYSLGQ